MSVAFRYKVQIIHLPQVPQAVQQPFKVQHSKENESSHFPDVPDFCWTGPLFAPRFGPPTGVLHSIPLYSGECDEDSQRLVRTAYSSLLAASQLIRPGTFYSAAAFTHRAFSQGAGAGGRQKGSQRKESSGLGRRGDKSGDLSTGFRPLAILIAHSPPGVETQNNNQKHISTCPEILHAWSQLTPSSTSGATERHDNVCHCPP